MAGLRANDRWNKLWHLHESGRGRISRTAVAAISQKSIRRSSAVAAIADRTAYDVRYTGKLSNRFRVASLRTAGRHDPIQRAEFMNAPKLNPLKRD